MNSALTGLYKHVKPFMTGCLVWGCLFNHVVFANATDLQPGVTRLKQQLQQDQTAIKRIESWKRLLRNKKTRTVAELLQEVNDFFNQLQYIPDSPLQGSADQWMTPYEFLAEGKGDCEDFAIAKYFTLVTMGVPEKKLRITYVTIPSQQKAHMVLTYYPTPDAEPYVLDNLMNQILPASKRTDLVPVYSFNGEEVWLNERIGKTRSYGKSSDLSQWQLLLQRLKQEEGN